MQEQIEKLIQEGHLSQYVHKGSEKAQTSPRATKKMNEGEGPRGVKEELKGEKRRERSRSPQRRDTRCRGVITTISGGGDALGA
ncbi:hypothetical protein CR513_16391, partial [Mucuna pruriens]